MRRAHAVPPPAGIGALLEGAQFVDAYRVETPRAGLEARAVARAMFDRQPAWVGLLMALRNAAVKPLGLKTARDAGDEREAIGLFPVESATPGRVVMGFEDRHLDFRVVVDVVEADGGSAITATTLVRLNNLLGHAYLTAILPFHMVIVRALLNRAAAG